MRWIVMLDVPRSGPKRANVLGVYPDDEIGEAAAAETMEMPGRMTCRIRADTVIEACQAAVAEELASRKAGIVPITKPAGDRDLGVADAAKHYGCSESVVRRAIRLGRLPARRVGERVLLIREADLGAWKPEPGPGWKKGRRRKRPRA